MEVDNEKIVGIYKIKFHKLDDYFYSDIFFAAGGYCIIQHKDKNKIKSEQKALNWIELNSK